MFAIVFGVSMDYEVFLLSHVKEHWDATGDNAASVAWGLSAAARVITCAALIMISVFISFVASTQVVIKMLGGRPLVQRAHRRDDRPDAARARGDEPSRHAQLVDAALVRPSAAPRRGRGLRPPGHGPRGNRTGWRSGLAQPSEVPSVR
jgi:hypothetical protein